jgi:hypothetical protein
MGSPIARQNHPPETRIVRSDICRALDFLLTRQTVSGEDQYHANFNSPSLDERINPTSGYPRPTVDTATKTKGYRVPPNLTQPYPTRRTPSRYSGFMRQVVGCYAARGADSPFDYGHTVTHGVVYVDVPKVSGPGTDRVYWLIEVNQGIGVFATPLRVVLNGSEIACCGSFGVEHLMPTPEEARKDPGLVQYRTTVSLWWYWQNRGGKVVKRVLTPDQFPMTGSGWYSEHGWAFSASGAEAQQVTQGQGSLDDGTDYFIGERHRLQFTASRIDVSAKYAKLDSDCRYTLMIDRTVWTPVSAGLWSGFPGPGIASLHNPLQKFPTQDAPVHVYYVGEVAQVVRWQLSLLTSAGSDTRATFIPGAVKPFPGHDCLPATTYQSKGTATSGALRGADTTITCGFSGPFSDGVGDNEGPRNDVEVAGFYGSSEIETSNVLVSNSFTLNPECWYYRTELDGTVHLVGGCIQPTRAKTYKNDKWTKTDNVSVSATKKTSIVLFQEEREAVLMVTMDSNSRTGSGSTSAGTGFECRETSEVEPGSSMNPVDCPPNVWDVGDMEQGSVGVVSDHSSTYSIDEANATAQLTLCLGAFIVSRAVGIDPTTHDINEADVATFLVCRVGPPEKSTAEGYFAAMKGNTTDSDRYYNVSGSPVVAGGFPYAGGEVVAFVGKT